ncbi:uncharacterized protein LOC113272035 [Papaver somniferum]|uniref:uncharacterized protein LOC113272035 n=1 Tax=Papaver somniferum TaxID=3469 RepID=UPI000E6F9B64|nr:uncharacterized protein LOC113272035 [Papaver somniferum]
MECQLCHSDSETIDHILVKCTLSQAVWFASPLTWRIQGSTDISLRACLQKWLLAGDDDHAFFMGACLLWSILVARNNLIYEKRNANVEVLIREGLYWFKKIYYHGEDNTGEISTRFNSTNSQVGMSQWTPPPNGKIKINVDAASKDGRASCVVVATDW